MSYTDGTDRTHTFYPVQPGSPGQPAYGILRDSTQATVALVLGIIALCSGLLFLSPVTWALGSQALAEIDAAPGTYSNRGMAQAGRVLGIVGTALLALALASFALFFVAI
jgi:hypothetical protein